MNFAMRVARDKPTPTIVKTVELFKPLITALDNFLCLLPPFRTIVFRGTRARVASNYKLGALVVWPQFTSTSVEHEEAKNFTGNEGTFFIIAHDKFDSVVSSLRKRRRL